jgi:hypothetical protein
VLYRAPKDNTWNQNAGINFAPLNQIPSVPAKPLNSDVCAHFARGHCKFGARCKKSHGLATQAAQNQPSSNETERLNSELRELVDSFVRLNGMSYSDTQYGTKLDQFVDFINKCVTSIKHTLTFTPSEDVAQSLFSHEWIQNMANYLNRWWASIAGDARKPNSLFAAIRSLRLLISDANQKMHLTTNLLLLENFANVNYFQDSAPQPRQGRKPFHQKMQLAPAPELAPQDNFSHINHFQNGSLRPNLGNNASNNSVSNNVRGDSKKGRKARPANYTGGNNDIYNANLGWNSVFPSVSNQRNRRNVPKHNNLYTSNVGLRVDKRRQNNGTDDRIPDYTQSRALHVGRGRDRGY